MNARSLFRPSWVAFIGFAPPIVVAIILAIIFSIHFEPNTMAYTGLAWMLYFPILVLFALGVVASTVSLIVTAKRAEGFFWSTLALGINYLPFVSMMQPFFR